MLTRSASSSNWELLNFSFASTTTDSRLSMVFLTANSVHGHGCRALWACRRSQPQDAAARLGQPCDAPGGLPGEVDQDIPHPVESQKFFAGGTDSRSEMVVPSSRPISNDCQCAQHRRKTPLPSRSSLLSQATPTRVRITSCQWQSFLRTSVGATLFSLDGGWKLSRNCFGFIVRGRFRRPIISQRLHQPLDFSRFRSLLRSCPRFDTSAI